MSEPARASAAPRLPGLDLLRAVAIGWVMIYHASNFDLVSDQPWYVAYGWMGVDLFFALSGYLIAGQLLRPWVRGGAPNYPHFFAAGCCAPCLPTLWSWRSTSCFPCCRSGIESCRSGDT